MAKLNSNEPAAILGCARLGFGAAAVELGADIEPVGETEGKGGSDTSSSVKTGFGATDGGI